MRVKRDCSVLYAALAGFVLCAVLLGGLFCTDTMPAPDIPMGSIYWKIDTFGGFPAEGIKMDIYQIQKDKMDKFCGQLMKMGFEETPVPQRLRERLAGDSDTVMLAEVSNGLWWCRENVTKGEESGGYDDFNFSLYDAENGIYYELLYVI